MEEKILTLHLQGKRGQHQQGQLLNDEEDVLEILEETELTPPR